MQVTKTLLIDALVGAGTGRWEHSERLVSLGLARPSGNQHNEAWSWNRDVLGKLPQERLEELYREIRPQSETQER